MFFYYFHAELINSKLQCYLHFSVGLYFITPSIVNNKPLYASLARLLGGGDICWSVSPTLWCRFLEMRPWDIITASLWCSEHKPLTSLQLPVVKCTFSALSLSLLACLSCCSPSQELRQMWRVRRVLLLVVMPGRDSPMDDRLNLSLGRGWCDMCQLGSLWMPQIFWAFSPRCQHIVPQSCSRFRSHPLTPTQGSAHNELLSEWEVCWKWKCQTYSWSKTAPHVVENYTGWSREKRLCSRKMWIQCHLCLRTKPLISCLLCNPVSRLRRLLCVQSSGGSHKCMWKLLFWQVLESGIRVRMRVALIRGFILGCSSYPSD